MAALTMLTPVRNSTTGFPSMVPVANVTPLTLKSLRSPSTACSAIHSGSNADITAVRGVSSSVSAQAGEAPQISIAMQAACFNTVRSPLLMLCQAKVLKQLRLHSICAWLPLDTHHHD